MSQCLSRGAVGYRTRFMTEERAERFARCLARNPRFRAVEVQEHRKDTERRFLVFFVPSNPDREFGIIAEQGAARQKRAEEQDMLFVRDESGRFCHCYSFTTGETYNTCRHSCDCDDFHHRLRDTPLAREGCKHMRRLRIEEARGGVWAAPDPIPAAPATTEAEDNRARHTHEGRVAEARRTMNRDFPD